MSHFVYMEIEKAYGNRGLCDAEQRDSFLLAVATLSAPLLNEVPYCDILILKNILTSIVTMVSTISSSPSVHRPCNKQIGVWMAVEPSAVSWSSFVNKSPFLWIQKHNPNHMYSIERYLASKLPYTVNANDKNLYRKLRAVPIGC